MDSHVWLRNKETGLPWLCPIGAVEDWLARGFEPTEPPKEHNPVIAEHLAWRAEREAAQQPTKEPAGRLQKLRSESDR